MAGFQVAGDLVLSTDRRRFNTVRGIERMRSRLNTLLQIASGSYEYSDVGVRYFDNIGHPINEGRLKQTIRDAAMSDPETLAVTNQTVEYSGNRAYRTSLVVNTAHGPETIVI